MSKRTIALLMPSPARLGPWGDEGWRPVGVIQYVADGPDFLWAGASRIGEGASEPGSPFDGMVVRDSPVEAAHDIAVMALAMLEAPGWRELQGWWEDVADRDRLVPTLRRVAAQSASEFKVGFVRFTDHVGESDRLAAVAAELEELGLGWAFFDQSL